MTMRGILSHQLEDMVQTAERQADLGPEGLIDELFKHINGTRISANDGVYDVLDGRYARGVADVLKWLTGEPASDELHELLEVED